MKWFLKAAFLLLSFREHPGSRVEGLAGENTKSVLRNCGETEAVHARSEDGTSRVTPPQTVRNDSAGRLSVFVASLP